MSLRIDLQSLDELASRLPFHLDDTGEVNEAYCAYRRQETNENAFVVDLWTYCFIRRYYLIKFISEAAFRAAELDHVVEKTYQKVERSRYQLQNDDRYAQWVSVICKNTYVNFVTRRKVVSTLDDADRRQEPEIQSASGDAGALYLALSRAIERLPVFLQSVARLRFVEDLSYEEISRITGKSVPVSRSYVHKICRRFRRDPELCAFREWYT
jgi:DNA-directed RNA polymerase specialized sigma24 family protein